MVFLFKKARFAKHFVVDWILLAICLLYFFIGLRKGFLTSVISVISFSVVLILSFKFCGKVAEAFDGMIGNVIQGGIKNGINGVVEGKFSSTEELLFYLMSTKYGKYFGVILKTLLKNVTFEGELSAGEIISPTLSRLLVHVVAFIVLAIGFSIAFKLIELILQKIVKLTGWKGDRLLGGVMGLAKGLVVFAVVFAILSAIANFTLSEKLLSFVRSGIISKQIYNRFIIKIINLFY